MVWVLVLNELPTSCLFLKKPLYFWGLVLQKDKKNASVTLTLSHSLQIQRKHALQKKSETPCHLYGVKWDTMDPWLLKVQAGAENITVKVQGLIPGPVLGLKKCEIHKHHSLGS